MKEPLSNGSAEIESSQQNQQLLVPQKTITILQTQPSSASSSPASSTTSISSSSTSVSVSAASTSQKTYNAPDTLSSSSSALNGGPRERSSETYSPSSPPPPPTTSRPLTGTFDLALIQRRIERNLKAYRLPHDWFHVGTSWSDLESSTEEEDILSGRLLLKRRIRKAKIKSKARLTSSTFAHSEETEEEEEEEENLEEANLESDFTSESSSSDEDVARLPISDIDVIGQHPGRENLLAIVCKVCKRVVKAGAFAKHMEIRHFHLITPIKYRDGILPPPLGPSRMEQSSTSTATLLEDQAQQITGNRQPSTSATATETTASVGQPMDLFDFTEDEAEDEDEDVIMVGEVRPNPGGKQSSNLIFQNSSHRRAGQLTLSKSTLPPNRSAHIFGNTASTSSSLSVCKPLVLKHSGGTFSLATASSSSSLVAGKASSQIAPKPSPQQANPSSAATPHQPRQLMMITGKGGIRAATSTGSVAGSGKIHLKAVAVVKKKVLPKVAGEKVGLTVSSAARKKGIVVTNKSLVISSGSSSHSTSTPTLAQPVFLSEGRYMGQTGQEQGSLLWKQQPKHTNFGKQIAQNRTPPTSSLSVGASSRVSSAPPKLLVVSSSSSSSTSSPSPSPLSSLNQQSQSAEFYQPYHLSLGGAAKAIQATGNARRTSIPASLGATVSQSGKPTIFLSEQQKRAASFSGHCSTSSSGSLLHPTALSTSLLAPSPGGNFNKLSNQSSKLSASLPAVTGSGSAHSFTILKGNYGGDSGVHQVKQAACPSTSGSSSASPITGVKQSTSKTGSLSSQTAPSGGQQPLSSSTTTTVVVTATKSGGGLTHHILQPSKSLLQSSTPHQLQQLAGQKFTFTGSTHPNQQQLLQRLQPITLGGDPGQQIVGNPLLMSKQQQQSLSVKSKATQRQQQQLQHQFQNQTHQQQLAQLQQTQAQLQQLQAQNALIQKQNALLTLQLQSTSAATAAMAQSTSGLPKLPVVSGSSPAGSSQGTTASKMIAIIPASSSGSTDPTLGPSGQMMILSGLPQSLSEQAQSARIVEAAKKRAHLQAQQQLTSSFKLQPSPSFKKEGEMGKTSNVPAGNNNNNNIRLLISPSSGVTSSLDGRQLLTGNNNYNKNNSSKEGSGSYRQTTAEQLNNNNTFSSNQMELGNLGLGQSGLSLMQQTNNMLAATSSSLNNSSFFQNNNNFMTAFGPEMMTTTSALNDATNSQQQQLLLQQPDSPLPPALESLAMDFLSSSNLADGGVGGLGVGLDGLVAGSSLEAALASLNFPDSPTAMLQLLASPSGSSAGSNADDSAAGNSNSASANVGHFSASQTEFPAGLLPDLSPSALFSLDSTSAPPSSSGGKGVVSGLLDETDDLGDDEDEDEDDEGDDEFEGRSVHSQAEKQDGISFLSSQGKSFPPDPATTSSAVTATTTNANLATGRPKRNRKRGSKYDQSLDRKRIVLCKDRTYNADEHCGVRLPGMERQCTRSLTCRTHLIALRRAVEGRSKPFDELLVEYRKERGMKDSRDRKRNRSQSKATLEAGVSVETTTLSSNSDEQQLQNQQNSQQMMIMSSDNFVTPSTSLNQPFSSTTPVSVDEVLFLPEHLPRPPPQLKIASKTGNVVSSATTPSSSSSTTIFSTPATIDAVIDSVLELPELTEQEMVERVDCRAQQPRETLSFSEKSSVVTSTPSQLTFTNINYPSTTSNSVVQSGANFDGQLTPSSGNQIQFRPHQQHHLSLATSPALLASTPVSVHASSVSSIDDIIQQVSKGEALGPNWKRLTEQQIKKEEDELTTTTPIPANPSLFPDQKPLNIPSSSSLFGNFMFKQAKGLPNPISIIEQQSMQTQQQHLYFDSEGKLTTFEVFNKKANDGKGSSTLTPPAYPKNMGPQTTTTKTTLLAQKRQMAKAAKTAANSGTGSTNNKQGSNQNANVNKGNNNLSVNDNFRNRKSSNNQHESLLDSGSFDSAFSEIYLDPSPPSSGGSSEVLQEEEMVKFRMSLKDEERSYESSDEYPAPIDPPAKGRPPTIVITYKGKSGKENRAYKRKQTLRNGNLPKNGNNSNCNTLEQNPLTACLADFDPEEDEKIFLETEDGKAAEDVEMSDVSEWSSRGEVSTEGTPRTANGVKRKRNLSDGSLRKSCDRRENEDDNHSDYYKDDDELVISDEDLRGSVEIGNKRARTVSESGTQVKGIRSSKTAFLTPPNKTGGTGKQSTLLTPLHSLALDGSKTGNAKNSTNVSFSFSGDLGLCSPGANSLYNVLNSGSSPQQQNQKFQQLKESSNASPSARTGSGSQKVEHITSSKSILLNGNTSFGSLKVSPMPKPIGSSANNSNLLSSINGTDINGTNNLTIQNGKAVAKQINFGNNSPGGASTSGNTGGAGKGNELVSPLRTSLSKPPALQLQLNSSSSNFGSFTQSVISSVEGTKAGVTSASGSANTSSEPFFSPLASLSTSARYGQAKTPTGSRSPEPTTLKNLLNSGTLLNRSLSLPAPSQTTSPITAKKSTSSTTVAFKSAPNTGSGSEVESGLSSTPIPSPVFSSSSSSEKDLIKTKGVSNPSTDSKIQSKTSSASSASSILPLRRAQRISFTFGRSTRTKEEREDELRAKKETQIIESIKTDLIESYEVKRRSSLQGTSSSSGAEVVSEGSESLATTSTSTTSTSSETAQTLAESSSTLKTETDVTKTPTTPHFTNTFTPATESIPTCSPSLSSGSILTSSKRPLSPLIHNRSSDSGDIVPDEILSILDDLEGFDPSCGMLAQSQNSNSSQSSNQNPSQSPKVTIHHHQSPMQLQLELMQVEAQFQQQQQQQIAPLPQLHLQPQHFQFAPSQFPHTVTQSPVNQQFVQLQVPSSVPAPSTPPAPNTPHLTFTSRSLLTTPLKSPLVNSVPVTTTGSSPGSIVLESGNPSASGFIQIDVQQLKRKLEAETLQHGSSLTLGGNGSTVAGAGSEGAVTSSVVVVTSSSSSGGAQSSPLRSYRNVIYTKSGQGSPLQSQQQLQSQSPGVQTTSPLQSRLITPKSQALKICFGGVNEPPKVTLTPKAVGKAHGQGQQGQQGQQQKQLQQLHQQPTPQTTIVATKSSSNTVAQKSQIQSSGLEKGVTAQQSISIDSNTPVQQQQILLTSESGSDGTTPVKTTPPPIFNSSCDNLRDLKSLNSAISNASLKLQRSQKTYMKTTTQPQSTQQATISTLLASNAALKESGSGEQQQQQFIIPITVSSTITNSGITKKNTGSKGKSGGKSATTKKTVIAAKGQSQTNTSRKVSTTSATTVLATSKALVASSGTFTSSTSTSTTKLSATHFIPISLNSSNAFILPLSSLQASGVSGSNSGVPSGQSIFILAQQPDGTSGVIAATSGTSGSSGTPVSGQQLFGQLQLATSVSSTTSANSTGSGSQGAITASNSTITLSRNNNSSTQNQGPTSLTLTSQQLQQLASSGVLTAVTTNSASGNVQLQPTSSSSTSGSGQQQQQIQLQFFATPNKKFKPDAP